MAKPSNAKSAKRDRRAVLEEMRREQQRAERKRTFSIIAAFAAVGLVIIGAAAYPVVRDALEEDTPLAEIGVSAQQAGCQQVTTRPATGNAEHKPDGTPIFYDAAPPATGPHYPVPAPMERKFYTAEDRPELGYLVHNLEHGYNILWYDETVAGDDDLREQVQRIAESFSGAEPTDKFIAAPWTAEDGEAFPGGAHIALTHWSLGGTNGNPEGQLGVWQYCEAPSGEAVARFVEDYPYTDSPEPTAP